MRYFPVHTLSQRVINDTLGERVYRHSALGTRHSALCTIKIWVFALMTLALSSCHVHEWPKGDLTQFALNLKFATEFQRYDFQYGDTKSEDGRSQFYTVALDHGVISYTIKAFPIIDGKIDRSIYRQYNFIRNIADGYDCTFDLDLDPAQYRIMVFAQLAESAQGPFYYDDSNFWEIKLQGEYTGDTDYRDAFRGMMDVEVGASVSATMQMTRPLAKYEFVSNDIIDFLDQETARRAGQRGAAEEADDSKAGNEENSAAGTRNTLADYTVMFYYIGYLPTAYNLPEDRNVDSVTGIKFESTPVALSESEASLGFDYVFCSTTETHVTVQIALYDNETGQRVSLSDQIRIPLYRSYDTVVTGSFLFENADSGIGIDPGFDDDFNIFFPV